MDKLNQFIRRQSKKETNESGQSIVLIALMLVALLSFVGIAVDVGFIFARQSQLQAAVDSAALSGVSDLILAANLQDTGPADIKAGQFLNANGVPITGTEDITITFNSSRDLTALGVSEYSVTVTWPVDLFFLKLIGREQITVTKSATAGINNLTDIYASRRVEDGTVSTSTQGIFGPRICTEYGDPFSPWTSVYEPATYTYRYRIMIPSSYPDDVVRVELFDPDSVNRPENEFTVAYTANAQGHVPFNAGARPTTRFCGPDGGSNEQKNPCVLRTQELEMVAPLSPGNGITPEYELDQINPFWFVRIDENRGSGTGGDDLCTPGSPAVYDTQYNTQTLFQLYYFRETNDGQLVESPIASYTGNTGDGRDVIVNGHGTTNHKTDMHWVSPGADRQGFDFPDEANGIIEVPTNEGNTSFEVSLSSDTTNISVDPNTGSRFLYLDVTSLSGASENGFEIWAGPATYAETEPSNVNFRNVNVVNDRSSHHSNGVVVFALGRLPMNSIYSNAVDIPLLFIGPEQAGANITVSLFDSDSGVEPPVKFFFDSISEDDWSLTFSDPGQTDPDGITTEPGGVRCQIGGGDNGVPGTGCNNQWVTPPYQLVVPGVLESCDYQNQNQDDCTPYYGGRLMVRYNGGEGDTYGWQINLSGLPFLIR